MFRQANRNNPLSSLSDYRHAHEDFVIEIGKLWGKEKQKYVKALKLLDNLECSGSINENNVKYCVAVLNILVANMHYGVSLDLFPKFKKNSLSFWRDYVCAVHDFRLYCPEAFELCALLIPFEEQYKLLYTYTRKLIKKKNNEKGQAILDIIHHLALNSEGDPSRDAFLFFLNEALCCLATRECGLYQDLKDQWVQADFFRELMRLFPQAEKLSFQMLVDENQYQCLKERCKDLLEQPQYGIYKETLGQLIAAIDRDRAKNPENKELLAETLWLVHDEITGEKSINHNQRMNKTVSELENRIDSMKPLVLMLTLQILILAAVCTFGFGFVATVPAWGLSKLVPAIIGNVLWIAATSTFFYDNSVRARTSKALKAAVPTKTETVPTPPSNPAP